MSLCAQDDSCYCEANDELNGDVISDIDNNVNDDVNGDVNNDANGDANDDANANVYVQLARARPQMLLHSEGPGAHLREGGGTGEIRRQEARSKSSPRR